MRVPTAAFGVLLFALALAGAATACGDNVADDGAQTQSQISQADDSQGDQGSDEQAQPIDAGQPTQSAQSSEDEAAQAVASQQSEEEPTQPASTDSDQGEAQPSGQQEEADQSSQDPNRDILVEGERFASSIGADEAERQFRFQAATGAWLRIFVDGKGGMDPVVTLLQPDGVEIAVNDDLSSTNRDSLILAQIPMEGLQFIRVQPFDASSIGEFVIQVQTLTIGADDDNAVLTVGDSADGRLNSPDDVDVFDFELAADQQVFVLVDGDTGVDVYAQVFQPDGNLLQTDDDGGHGLDAEIYFTADTAGVWRVEVWPALNRAGQRQLIGAYRVSVGEGLPTSAVNDAVASDLAGSALTFLQALRDGDSATILALAGPEAQSIWGWDDASDIDRDIQKIQSIDLGGEFQQSVSYGDVLHDARGRVYFQLDESDWLRFELIQLGGRWLVDDWAHSIGPPG